MVTHNEIQVKATRLWAFRRVFPQIVATAVKNLLILDFALSTAFPTILIPALTPSTSEGETVATIYMTPMQISWLGKAIGLASLMYVFQPLGNVMSGWLLEPIGRKHSMIIVNVPHIVGWYLLYSSCSAHNIFGAYVLFGIGNGLMGAPMNTYGSEICQPSIRGVLMATSNLSAAFGVFMVFFLGTLISWRHVALINLCVPIVAICALCFLPETPIWLISKNREEEALKSLQWLRGWVSPSEVQHEFEALKRYQQAAQKCPLCTHSEHQCKHPTLSLREKCADLLHKKTFRPFILLAVCFFIAQFSGNLAMRPYFVKIMSAYNVPMNPKKATVVLGGTGIIGSMVCISVVRFTGKRCLFLLSLFVVCISNISLGIYSYVYLPHDSNSFSNQIIDPSTESSYFPLAMFILMTLFTYIGVTTVPWMLIAELFPFKTRTLATGITAASNDIFTFIAIKTYWNFESILKLHGVVWFYASVCLLGLALMYFVLPETENCSLQEIEMHFTDKSRKWTDRKIHRTADETAKEDFCVRTVHLSEDTRL